MGIKGIEGLSIDDIDNEINRGGKFIFFTYCFSIIIMTFRRPTNIYFVRANESVIKYGWPWFLISLLFGWWGIPWGPIYTIQALFRSFSGKDVTMDILNSMHAIQAEQYAKDYPEMSWDNFNTNNLINK